MPREYKLYIEDILNSIKSIEDYTKNYTYDNFAKNKFVYLYYTHENGK